MSTRNEAEKNLDLDGLDKEKEGFTEADAGDGTKREDHYLHGIKLVLCITSLMLNMMLISLDQTIVATIVTSVGNQFNSFGKIGWLSSGFLLPMTVLSANWGQLSIIFGRKWVLLISIIIFEAGSLMCALSQNMDTLIGGRVLGGIGASGVQANVFIIVSEIVDMHHRPLVFSVFSAVVGICAAAGPLIGGAFTSSVSWRWCFYINLPIGGVALVLFFFVFNPPSQTNELKDQLKKLDFIGTFLLASGLSVFFIGLTFASTNQYTWDSAAVITCIILGVLTTIAYIIWNWKFSSSRIIPLDVAVVPQITAAAFSIFGSYSTLICSTLYLSIYFQNICGRSALHAGLSLLPLIIPVVIFSVLSGIIIKRTLLVKPFAILSSSLLVIGAGLLTLLDVGTSDGKNIGLLIILGIGQGFIMQTNLASAQLKAPKTPGGLIMTTTYIVFWRNLGGTLGGIISGVAYNSALQSSLSSALSSLPYTNPELAHELSGFNIDDLSQPTKVFNSLSSQAESFIQKYMMIGIKDAFYFSLGTAALCFIAAIFTTNKKLPKKAEIVNKEIKKGPIEDSEQNVETNQDIEESTN